MSQGKPARSLTEVSVPLPRSAGEATALDALLFRAAFDNAPVGMCIASVNGELIRVNSACAELLGYPVGALVGRQLSDLAHDDDQTLIEHWVRTILETEGAVVTETRFEHADERVVWVRLSTSAVRRADGSPAYVITHMEDVSERKQSEARVVWEATHDPLTRLPNRTLLLSRINHALVRNRRTGLECAVLFIDLDHFKVVNDSLGHAVGDRLLQEVAARLSHAVRPYDTVARLGGDEFVVLCEDLERGGLVELLAHRVQVALLDPIDLEGRSVVVGASIGIARATQACAPEDLLRDADLAMYLAKEGGRGQHAVFDETLRAKAVARLEGEAELRRAIAEDELRLVYQPVVDLASSRVVGVEALMRWEHPVKGLLAPAYFLQLAEDSGLVVDLGRFALEEGCRQLAEWRARYPSVPLELNVNVSPQQVMRPDLEQMVLDALDASDLPASSLCLEITEGTLVLATQSVGASLQELRQRGVKIAIDDFGTGYSSLSYLQQLPVDTLKVDRSFVAAIDAGDETGAAIVETVCDLARALGLRSVVEGVETAETLERLRLMGCDQAQGYYLGRPSAPDVIAELLAAEPALPAR